MATEALPTLAALEIAHFRTAPQLIATLRTLIKTRAEVPPYLAQAAAALDDAICGPGLMVYHLGTGTDGFDVEIGFPVARQVAVDGLMCRELEQVEVLAVTHHGPLETLRQTYSKIYDYMGAHGLPGALFAREIYHHLDAAQPETCIVEFQIVLHDWNERFAANVERVLGAEAREEILAGAPLPDVHATMAERLAQLNVVAGRLNARADDFQRYDIVSSCAHVFPQERIDRLRAIYAETHDLDAVIGAMHQDHFWFEKPLREGNVIYVNKNPVDPEGYEKAETLAEKRTAYCHCPLVRQLLDQADPTLCLCGAGWYRRLWEGILGQPVRIELLESLVRGDDRCRVAIHLPL